MKTPQMTLLGMFNKRSFTASKPPTAVNFHTKPRGYLLYAVSAKAPERAQVESDPK